MPPDDGGYRDAAVAALADRTYEQAGNYYTRSGWRILATPRADTSPFTFDEQGWVGVGLGRIARAVASYRVGGQRTRARQRGVAGIATAQDLITQCDRPIQQACLYEYIGDCHVLTETDPTAAYERAVETYHESTISDPQRWATSALFEAVAGPLKQLARGQADGEIAVTWDDLHGADPSDPGAFLSQRVKYKQQHLKQTLTAAVEDGHLAAPRGSTAYGTDSYRCPGCGASDVNWVGESTLCLRCSRPMNRVD